jgi:hypothetical protein
MDEIKIMKNEDKLEQKVKYLRIGALTITICIALFGIIGGYVSDRTAINHNKYLIQQNEEQLQEFKIDKEKQSTLLQQILIKVTRLEAIISQK